MRFVGGDAEHAQQVLGDLVGGVRVVAFGLVVQELAQAQGGARDDGQGEFRVTDDEASRPGGGVDVAAGSRGESFVRSGEGEGVVQKDHAELGPAPVQSTREPEAAGEDLGRVVESGGVLLEQLTAGVERLLDGGLEQLLLVEVVVERARSHVGRPVISMIDASVFPAAMTVCAPRTNAARVRSLRRC